MVSFFVCVPLVPRGVGVGGVVVAGTREPALEPGRGREVVVAYSPPIAGGS